jgi:large subunit ribosomal protein L15
MNLHEVNQGIHKHRRKKRLGRGPGSGLGKTSGRGHNGQRSRAGHSQSVVFQGGTMPLVRRVPKRGFTNRWALKIGEVNLRDLEARFEAGEEVTPESLKARNLASHRYDELKILGNGELTKKLKVSAHRFSKSAREKIEKAGGEIVVLQRIVSVEEKKRLSREAAGKPVYGKQAKSDTTKQSTPQAATPDAPTEDEGSTSNESE